MTTAAAIGPGDSTSTPSTVSSSASFVVWFLALLVVGHGFMARDHGEYWRAGATIEP